VRGHCGNLRNDGRSDDLYAVVELMTAIVYSPNHIAWAKETFGSRTDLMKAIEEIEEEQKVVGNDRTP